MTVASHAPIRTLGDLVTPLDEADFRARVLHREPAHLARPSDANAGLLTVEGMQQALTAAQHHPEAVRLSKATGPGLPPNRAVIFRTPAGSFAEPGRLSIAALHNLLSQGYTITLNNLAAFSDSVRRAQAVLAHVTGTPVTANAYLTPSHGRGYHIHHDDHTTLLFQIHGSKRWRIWEPVVPMPSQGQQLDHQQIESLAHTAPALELTLTAGDLLHLPPGWPHEGVGLDETSLHVTFGSNPRRVADVITAAIGAMALQEGGLRDLAPRDPSEEVALVTSMIDLLASVTPQAAPVDVTQVMASIRRRRFERLANAATPPAPSITSTLGEHSLPAEAVVGPDLTTEWFLLREDDAVTLRHGDGQLSYRGAMADAVERAVTEQATVADLTALGGKGTAQVLLALLQAGVIRVSAL